VAESYQVTVEDVFTITGRGIAIIGNHAGGVIHSGDHGVLRSDDAEVAVPEIVVEIHHPPEKIALLLRGVEREDVNIGAILFGPSTD
jgi:translation elongation factor EF-Tu-like GTPase